jgi:hypothetical protein
VEMLAIKRYAAAAVAERDAEIERLRTVENERDILRTQTLDLALLVGRLIRRMRAARAGQGMAAGDEALEQQVIGYLRRNGLTSPLRAEGPNGPCEPETPAQEKQR